MTQCELKTAYRHLPPSKQLFFLAVIAHDLTIRAREFIYPQKGEELLAVSKLRCFNELLHSVTSQLVHIAADDSRRYPDEVFVEILFEKAQMEGCERALIQGWERSLSFLPRETPTP